MDSRITLLEQLIAEGKKFTFNNFCFSNEGGSEFGGDDTAEWLAWKTRVGNVVQGVVSPESPAARLAQEAISIRTRGNYHDKFDRAKSTLLKSLELSLAALQDDTFGELHKEAAKSESPRLSNRVFVVHGHDHALKTDVETFLHQIGLEPVVLHRQPDQGRTIIEKFEHHSDVGYAIVLLTPDDIGYTADQEKLKEQERTKEFRARPNVIFEFGYFVGKLGRNRVCCLYKSPVALPSEIDGLVYKHIDGSLDGQAYSLIKELKAAGYSLKL